MFQTKLTKTKLDKVYESARQPAQVPKAGFSLGSKDHRRPPFSRPLVFAGTRKFLPHAREDKGLVVDNDVKTKLHDEWATVSHDEFYIKYFSNYAQFTPDKAYTSNTSGSKRKHGSKPTSPTTIYKPQEPCPYETSKNSVLCRLRFYSIESC